MFVIVRAHRWKSYAILALTLIGTALAVPALADENYWSDVWALSDFQRQIDADQTRQLEIEREIASRTKRIEMKESAARDVLEGRMSLPDAADFFLRANAMHPNALEQMRSNMRGSTDRVKAANQVISFVDGLLKNRDRSAVIKLKEAAAALDG